MRKQIGRTLLETQTSLWAMHSYNQTNREATNLLISFHKTHKKRIEPRTKIKFPVVVIDGTHKKNFNFLCAMAQPTRHNKHF
jgi:hypothetical protein